MLNYSQNATTTDIAADIDGYLRGIATDIINANGNKMIRCIAFRSAINCLGSIVDANIITNNLGEASYRLDCHTSTQLANLIGLGYNINYIGGGDIDLNEVDLTIASGQVITLDESGTSNNIVCRNIINNGTLTGANIITAQSINNAGNISAQSIVCDNVINSGTIDLESMSVTGTFTNHSALEINDLTIIDVFTNNGNVNSKQLVNNGTINNTSGEIRAWYVTNNNNINNSGTLNAVFSLSNIAGAVITNNTSGIIIFDYPSANNAGSIVNNGTIQQQYVEALLNSAYGVYNNGLTLNWDDTKYVLSGSVSPVADDSEAAAMYPTGSGYYVSLLVYVDITKAGQLVDITFNRTEVAGATYDYTTKSTTDTLTSSGAVEIIIDLNMLDRAAGLSTINITIDGKAYIIAVDGVIAAK